MILITSFGEFSCICIFFSVFRVFNFVSFYLVFFYLILPFLVESFFFLCLVFALFAAVIHFQWVKNSEGKQFNTGLVGLNCDQMKEGEQYSEYPVERNPRAYLSMRDYINRPWQNQQPVERNPNEYRSMKDYRNQWLSSPYGSTYNHSWGNHTNTSWEPRPPQGDTYGL